MPATSVQTCAASRLPRAWLDLAWRTFFADRGRGLSLDAHFPWLRGGGGRDDRAFFVERGGEAAAMLVLRRGVIGPPPGVGFHAIGLVCTAPAHARQGLASLLVRAALETVGADMPVLLWTRQHGFYERFGFELVDPSLIADCTLDVGPDARPRGFRSDWRVESEPSPLFRGARGLPSFVNAAHRVRMSGAGAGSLVVSDTRPVIVLDMADPADVVAIRQLGVSRIVLNLPRRKDLLHMLACDGARIVERETGIAMWRPGWVATDAIRQWDVPLLDRF